jgi:hypothetical protein
MSAEPLDPHNALFKIYRDNQSVVIALYIEHDTVTDTLLAEA